MLDFSGETDLAQVVFQIARVKMPPLAVPGKNGIAQHLEARISQFHRREFFLDDIEDLRMHYHGPH